MNDQIASVIQEKITKEYNLGEIKMFEQYLFGGLAGNIFYIEAEAGKFTFKVFGKKVDISQAKVIFSVLKFLEGFEVKIPKAFVTVGGEAVIQLSDIFPGRLAILLSCTPADFWPQFNNMKEVYFREIVGEIARLHQALRHYKGEQPKQKRSYFEFWRENLQEIKKLWSNNPLELNMDELSLGEHALVFVEECLTNQHENIQKVQKAWPVQLIHGDLNKHNFLFYKKHLSGIVDFDDIKLGFVQDDWAMFLGSLFSLDGSSPNWLKAFEIICEVLKTANNGVILQEEDIKARTIAFLLDRVLKSWKLPRNEEERNLLRRWYNNSVRKIISLIS